MAEKKQNERIQQLENTLILARAEVLVHERRRDEIKRRLDVANRRLAEIRHPWYERPYWYVRKMLDR